MGVGAKLVFPDNITREQLTYGLDLSKRYLGGGITEIIDPFREAIKAESPDIIVCDFVSAFGSHSADELGIPCVMHVPGPLDVCSFVSRVKYPGNSRLMSCCGMFCLRMDLLDAVSELNLDCLISRKNRDHFYAFHDRITICISFFGLD